MSNSNDPLKVFESMQQGIADKRQNIENIEKNFSNLDTTMNFKVNSLLKINFEELCRQNHSNPSREIKLFMLRAIKNGRF